MQGLLTASYIPPGVKIEVINQHLYNRLMLAELLYVSSQNDGYTSCSHAYRVNNALVLSENLDQESVQALVDIELKNLHPEQCDEWLSNSQFIRDEFTRERKERKNVVVRNVAGTEDSLRHVLREAVVDHVIGIFPYVVIQSYLNETQKIFLDTGR